MGGGCRESFEYLPFWEMEALDDEDDLGLWLLYVG